jgi:hypothetical protein
MPASLTISSHAYGAAGSAIARSDGDRSVRGCLADAVRVPEAASASGGARAGGGASASGDRMRRASLGGSASGYGAAVGLRDA